MVETLGIVAFAIMWIRAERADNQELWKVIQALVSLRLKQIESDNEEEPQLTLR